MENNEYKNIQQSVDSMLGVTSVIKRRRKNETDKKKELFAQMINTLEEAVVKSTIAYTDLDLDLSRYDERFFIVIDILVYLGFGENCAELISYYVWERYAPDGSIIPIVDTEGHEIFLNSPYDLWDLMCSINPTIIK